MNLSFLRLVLPNDDPKLRHKVSSKNPGLLDPGEHLNYDIEYGLSKLFMKEIEAMQSLEHQKIILMKCKDYSPEQAFFKIDVDGNNMLDQDTVSNYLKSYTNVDDDLLGYTMRYLDRDGDGLVSFQDFCNILYPQERFASIPQQCIQETKTAQTKSNIVSNYMNLSKTSQLSTQEMMNVGKKSMAQSKISNGTYDSLNIHKEICHILKEIINAERALEIEKQDLYLSVDFDPKTLYKMIDSSDSGLITQIQFEEWLNGQPLQMFPDAQQMYLFFLRYDKDQDGRLQFSDILEAVQPKQKEYASLRKRGDPINDFSPSTWVSIRKLFGLIFQCESVIEAIKINLFQTQHINRTQQLHWFEKDHNGFIDQKAYGMATKLIGLQFSEKDIWFLQNRFGTKMKQDELFDQLEPKTQ